MQSRLTLVFVASMTLVVGALYLFGRERIQGPRRPSARTSAISERTRLETVWLYFGSPDRAALQRERRTIAAGPSLDERIGACVSELARGSLEGRISVLPPTTRLRRAFLDPWGVVYLDLDRSIRSGRPPVDGEEWLAVGSLVRTVCENFAEVNAVRFMVDGEVIATLGGYVDLEEPLTPEQFAGEAVER